MFLGASAATPPSRAVYDFVEWSGASALVDLDGDGELDLLVASKTSDNVSVWMGTGNGGFGLPKFYLVSSSPQSITTGDFNGDGKLDVVTSNGSELSILMGVGDGTFADQVTLPAGGPVAAGDFNGDGKLDLAILNRAGAIVSVYLNDGAGTFTASVGQSTADIAGDELDVVVANNGASSVTVLLGHGDGTLEGPATFPVGMNPLLMRLVDLDGDGNLDIVTASSTDLSLSVLLGRGDGTFAAPIRYPLQAPPGWLETADLNGDGVPDLLEVGPLGSNGDGTDDLNVLLGLGHGLFATPLVFDAGPYPQSLAVGDLDHDGRLDVVAACIRDVSVLFNQGKWLCGPSR
jgi:hypothetical protein